MSQKYSQYRRDVTNVDYPQLLPKLRLSRLTMRTSVCQALALSVGLLATLPAVESVVIGIDFGADWFKVRSGADVLFWRAHGRRRRRRLVSSRLRWLW